MNVCMIVHNSATRDGRVMREAHSLQAAGYSVTVIGVPDQGASAPIEVLTDGVRIMRVSWQARAYGKLFRSFLLRVMPWLIFAGLVVYLLIGIGQWLVQAGRPLAAFADVLEWLAANAARMTWLSAVYGVFLLCLAAAILYAIWLAVLHIGRLLWGSVCLHAADEEAARRLGAPAFNLSLQRRILLNVSSLIPIWIPDFLIEAALEPLNWFGAKTRKFALYRYRAQEVAKVAIGLRPDVVHCHDCVALPTGWLVKRALNIPLIYDAHEIYEAVATRAFGVTEYYARVHRKYLSRVDGFIAVNDSAALYYRHRYPAAQPAVVIRNATNLATLGDYDGRLHDAAGLPRDARILLYQGGFTLDRGLPGLVRAGRLLPDGWYLVMMGWGPLAGELKRIACSSRSRVVAARKVRFVAAAPADELLSWTQGAAAGIIPYENKMLNHWISTPNKLWEYANAGVPLIVQPYPEMRRIVETYHCGWLLPKDFSPAGIAGVIYSLTDEMIARAREGCRQFARMDSWSGVYERRLLDLYGRLSIKTTAEHNIAVHMPGVAPAM